MPLESDEYDELCDILRDAVGSNSLSEWERGFVSDLNNRVEQYGMDVRVSAKQWECLRRIQGKL